MHNKKWLLRAFREVNLILALGAMSACGAGSEKWKEEVELKDGRVLVVERKLMYERGGDELAHNRSGSKPKEHLIRFMWPIGSGRVIEWKTTRKTPSTWPEIPLLLDIEDGHPEIISIADVSPACENYFKYIYKNGSWIEIKLPDKFEQRKVNLYIGYGWGMPVFITLGKKKIENKNLSFRAALRQIGPSKKICG